MRSPMMLSTIAAAIEINDWSLHPTTLLRRPILAHHQRTISLHFQPGSSKISIPACDKEGDACDTNLVRMGV